MRTTCGKLWDWVRGVVDQACLTTATILTLTTACSAEYDVALKIRDTRADKSVDVVGEACDLWGLVCWESTSSERGGVIVLILTDLGDDDYDEAGNRTLGETFWRSCGPVVWSRNDTYTLAHELGHALGLEHVGDPARLMHKSAGGALITFEEMDHVYDRARDLRSCP